MSARARLAYDRWRDAKGQHIPDGCRVEQVLVSRDRGAYASQLGQRGCGRRCPCRNGVAEWIGQSIWCGAKRRALRELERAEEMRLRIGGLE